MNGEPIPSKNCTTILVAAALLFWIRCVTPNSVDLTVVRIPRVTSIVETPPRLTKSVHTSVPMKQPDFGRPEPLESSKLKVI